MPHPYISRIEIQNFRNFRHLAIDLDPTAVFVGQNKSGKSNLVDALRLIFDPSLPDTARRLRPEDFWDGLEKPFAGAVIEVKVHLRDFDDNKAAKALLGDCLVEKEPLTAAVTYQFRPRDHAEGEKLDDLGEEDYDFIVFGGTDESNPMGYELRRWLALVVLPALRDAQTDLQNWRRSPLRPLLERVRKQIADEELEDVRDKLDEAKETLLAAKPVKELIDALNARMKELAGPVQAVVTELDFAPSEPVQLFRSLRVFIEERSTKPIADASLGTANMLFLALLLQDLEMRQSAKEIVSTIMAIEEPEAHLHPQLQRLLFKYFLGREHPILLTTHSPNIASVAPLTSTILLREHKGESHAYSARGVGFKPEEVADLQRYLDVTRAEILFARGVILVEGMAEQFVVTAFAESYLKAKKLGSSLDDFGISICAVDGTDFHPYWRLLSPEGFAIPCVVITDGDERTVKDKTVWDGIGRAKCLLRNAQVVKKVEAYVDAGEEPKAVAILAEHGLYVGHRTLELDLVSKLTEEMKATYKELRQSNIASERFDAAMDQADKNGEAAAEVLRRIETISKGRFAQRLAGKIEDQAAPQYLALAIQHIVNLVK
jgi:putative ATP-dependent endonuclease of OLD family